MEYAEMIQNGQSPGSSNSINNNNKIGIIEVEEK